MGKCNKARAMGKVWEIKSHIFPIPWVLFFPYDSHPVVCFSIWGMHWFPNKFPTVRENAKNPMVWEKSGRARDTKALIKP